MTQPFPGLRGAHRRFWPSIAVWRRVLAVCLLAVSVVRAGETGDVPAPDSPKPEAEKESKPTLKAGKTRAELLAEKKVKQLYAQSWSGKNVVVQLHTAINVNPLASDEEKTDKQVIRAIDKADEDGAKTLILDVDSPGGEVQACGRIATRLLNAKTPSVAFVSHKAISGGAMVALACGEVVVTKGSLIGDIRPIQVDPTTGEVKTMDPGLQEKQETFIRAQMKAIAEVRGKPLPLLEAMVSLDMEITRVDFDSGPSEYLTRDKRDLLEKNIKEGLDQRTVTGRKLINEKNRLLTLAPEEALRCGVANRLVPSREALFKEQGWDDDGNTVTLPVTDAEFSFDFSRFFPEELPGWASMLLVLFLVVAVAGLWLEYHAPGSGVPGAVGFIGLVSFFAILMMHDRGSWLGVALFIVGAALLIVEIFLIPGFGITGIAGIVCIFAGLFLAYLPDLDWTLPASRDYLGDRFFAELGAFVVLVFLALVGGALLTWLGVSYGHKLPGFQSLLMTTRLKSGKEALDESRRAQGIAVDGPPPGSEWIGRTGKAKTLLRPAGKVALDGDGVVLDVVTTGEWLEVGAPVKVVSASDWHIVVTAVADDRPSVKDVAK